MALNAQTLLNRLTTRARLRHLQALVQLDDLRSMSRAAQAMGMTQPAMTQLVAELEALLETTLFLRHSRGVDPTPVAQDLLPVARRVLSAMEEGAQRIATRLRRDSGPVRVAATVSGVGAVLDAVLPDLARRQPALQVFIDSVVGQELNASFAGDSFDMVICRRMSVVPEGWTFVPCLPDDAVIVCGAAHPLAAKPAVSAQDLASATWLQNHVATLARHQFEDLRDAEKWQDLRETAVISRVPLLVWSMLRDGRLLTLTPRSVVAPWLAEGSLVALNTGHDLPLEPVGFYWKPQLAGPSTKGLAEGLQRAFGGQDRSAGSRSGGMS